MLERVIFGCGSELAQHFGDLCEKILDEMATRFDAQFEKICAELPDDIHSDDCQQQVGFRAIGMLSSGERHVKQ